MNAAINPISGQLVVQGRVRTQARTQANIRGEPNAFPIRTVWYHHLPNGHAYKNFMTDDDLSDNKIVIQHDLDVIYRAWQSGRYRAIVFPHHGVGTGVANLGERAPKTFAFLNTELKRLKSGIETTDPATLRARHDEEYAKRREAVEATQHTVHEDE